MQQGPLSTELRPEMNHFPRRTEEGAGVCRYSPRGPNGPRGAWVAARRLQTCRSKWGYNPRTTRVTAIWIHILNGCRSSFASGAFVFSDCSRLTSERLTAALWQGSSLAWSTNGYPHGLDLRRLRHTNPKNTVLELSGDLRGIDLLR